MDKTSAARVLHANGAVLRGKDQLNDIGFNDCRCLPEPSELLCLRYRPFR